MVVNVDEKVRLDGALDRFLEEAGPLFVQEGLERIAGVVLLHKHNDLGALDAMVQRIEQWHGDEALVCKRTASDDQTGDIFPMNFAVTATGELAAIEYSESKKVDQKVKALFKHKQFIARFGKLAAEYGLLPEIGLSIATRDLFTNSDSALVPLEVCDVERQANILTLVSPQTFEAVNTMQTNWFFSASAEGGCKIICAYRCFARSPGHSKEHAGQTHAMDA